MPVTGAVEIVAAPSSELVISTGDQMPSASLKLAT
jgi:hypothetical protein